MGQKPKWWKLSFSVSFQTGKAFCVATGKDLKLFPLYDLYSVENLSASVSVGVMSEERMFFVRQKRDYEKGSLVVYKSESDTTTFYFYPPLIDSCQYDYQ